MKNGFTLAEVLITLGVIGVVAALTMPNLLQNYQKKVFATQLQRTLNLISNSATQLVNDENAPTLANTYLVPVNEDYKNAQGKFMNKYFKVARDCGTENYTLCLGDTYFSSDRTESEAADVFLGSDELYCVTINTGATICMSGMSSDSINDGSVKYGKARITIDVNGSSNPNTDGLDLFQYNLYSDGRLEEYVDSDDSGESSDQSDSSDSSSSSGDMGDKPELFSDSAQKIGDYWVDVKGGSFPSPIDCSNTSSQDYEYCGGITTSDVVWGWQAAANKACDQQGGRVPSMAELDEIYSLSNGSLMDNYSDGYKQYGITQSTDGKWYTDQTTGKQYYNAECHGMSNGWHWSGGCAHSLMCIK